MLTIPKFAIAYICVSLQTLSINQTISSHPMPRISEKRQLGNELVYTVEAAALAMILDSDSEFDSEGVENDYYDLVDTLALVCHAISDSRYLNYSTRGSASRLPTEDAISEYLRYPDRSFVGDFRMYCSWSISTAVTGLLFGVCVFLYF